MPSCPWEAMLPSLGLDALDLATFAVIEQHVENCAACQFALEKLVPRWADDRPAGTDPLPLISGFEIERELGRGAMGVVYLANQTGLGRRVALKVLHGGAGANALPTARRRWLREARAVSSIRHPNVVSLYDYGETDGCFYLVLEYVPGGSLKKRLEQPLPPRLAAALVETIASAVAYIHGKGLLHLDLKPSNILLDCEGNASWDGVIPRVADFGLALTEGDNVLDMSLTGPRGTPSYMAPEQTVAPDIKIGPGADIYALGAILFELLTGRPPFQGPSTIEVLNQVRSADPVPPRRLNPAIHRDLEIVCLNCLEKDPGRRYGSADAVAGDLRRWLGGYPILARPASPLEKNWRWCRRHPAIASLTAALALALTCGFVGMFALWRSAETERARAEEARRLTEDNEKFASSAMSNLLEAFNFALHQPERLSEELILARTYALRKQTSDLKHDRRFTPQSLHRLGVLERLLAERLAARGKRAEARELLIDSVANLNECRQLDPGDENAIWQLGQSQLHSGHVAISDSAFDEAIAAYNHASSLSGVLRTVTYRLELINDVVFAKARLAIELTRSGELERARRVIEPSVWMPAALEGTIAGPPMRSVDEEQARNIQVQANYAFNEVRFANQSFPDDPRVRKQVDRYLANLLALEISSLATAKDLAEATKYDDDTEAWAQSLVSSIRSRFVALAIGDDAVPAVALRMMDLVSSVASAQRRTGQLKGADRTAGRLTGLARQLVRSHGDQSDSHMLLSEAYFQMSKNAWEREDYPAIQQALRQALESAREAIRLDPERQDARHLVDRLLPRLAFFDGGRSSGLSPAAQVGIR
jgi:eukaryotic-like serine/threonine-protein kinase